MGLSNAVTSEVVEESDEPVENERQRWALAQMRSGGEVRKADIVAKFGCSSKTAERDLRDLRRRGLIEFVGAPKTGHWRVVAGR